MKAHPLLFWTFITLFLDLSSQQPPEQLPITCQGQNHPGKYIFGVYGVYCVM